MILYPACTRTLPRGGMYCIHTLPSGGVYREREKEREISQGWGFGTPTWALGLGEIGLEDINFKIKTRTVGIGQEI